MGRVRLPDAVTSRRKGFPAAKASGWSRSRRRWSASVPGLTAIYRRGRRRHHDLARPARRVRWRAPARETIADIVLLLTAGLFLMSPNYAWYFLALVPFIPLGAARQRRLGADARCVPALPAGLTCRYNDLDLEDARHAAVPPRRSRSAWRRPAPERLRCDSPTASAIVSVVIPCLNEEEPIAGVVTEVLAQGVDEVIVVDNGSTDATAARAAAAGARVVSEPRRGYGRACAAGFAAVRAGCRHRLLSRRRRQRRAGFPRRRGRPGRDAARRISSWARGCAASARPAA